MPSIVVCPLSRLEATVRSSGAEDVVTLMRQGDFDVPRLSVKRHLRIELSDIAEARDGYVLPGVEHLQALLAFAWGWSGGQPLLLHCYAGVSRSTAAAFVLACALRPHSVEIDVARRLRTLSPTATPNPKIVAIGDGILSRSGRMVEAVASIGRGADCFEGVPFSLDLDECRTAGHPEGC